MRAPDLFDQAQELEELMRAEAIERSRWHGGACSAEQCDCGAEIPEERRRALPGVQTCVDCAAAMERGMRRRGSFDAV